MKKLLTLSLLLAFAANSGIGLAQKRGKKAVAPAVQQTDWKVLDSRLPVRAFSILLAERELADDFIGFVREDLIPAGINTLIIRVNWNFNYQRHPELAASGAWEMTKIKELVEVCREGGVRIVPLVNLFGHQSWADKPGKLLEHYPHFDERPKVPLYEKWPNPGRVYCKSYCPNHPEVHRYVFDCIDEVIEAFEATDFHAGMDEVFDIADVDCPRCKGMDPAEVFAAEVNKISMHLKKSDVRLWIWADRLLDGRAQASGYGEWSASMNNTHRAIDLIDRSVMMCDWHYRNAEQSPVLFAIKGYDVITCGWERPDVTALQVEDIIRYRHNSSARMANRFKGYMQTVWSSYRIFINEYRNGSEKSEYSANNYTCLKRYLKEHAAKFASVEVKTKEQTTVFGQ